MPEPVVPTPSTEPKVVTMVVGGLVAITMLGLAGIIALLVLAQVDHHKVDAAALAIVAAITSGAAGSLGTMLASTRSGDAIPPQVQNTLAKLNKEETARMVAHLTTTDGNGNATDPAADTLLPGNAAGPPAVWDAPPSA